MAGMFTRAGPRGRLEPRGQKAQPAGAFAALIYTLFFALPFDETYAKQNNGRYVCDRGVYALCRHPGILCFFA